jgi:hypothetical protein
MIWFSVQRPCSHGSASERRGSPNVDWLPAGK